MMNWDTISTKIRNNENLSDDECKEILSDSFPYIKLIQLAYSIRYQHFKNTVRIHILNNAQNGHCPEDCSYCAQAKTSKSDIERYSIKSQEIAFICKK